MTKAKRKVSMRALAVLMSTAMVVPFATPALPALAAEITSAPSLGYLPDRDTTITMEQKLVKENYELVWSDEFDGDTLNTDDWNVELHEPGWVNDELQRYTKLDEGNIEVKDGSLHLYPKAVKKEGTAGEVEAKASVLAGENFDSNWSGGAGEDAAGSYSAAEGVGTVVITDPGTKSHGIQVQQAGLSLQSGHTYSFRLKAKSSVERATQISVMDTEGWKWYAGTSTNIGTDDTEIAFNFTFDKADTDTVALQINFGLIDGMASTSVAATVTLEEVELIDLTAAEEVRCKSVIAGENFDSNWSGGVGEDAAGSYSAAEGVATVVCTDPGTKSHGIQVQQAGLSLENGHEYSFRMKAKSDVERAVQVSVMDTEGWKWYAGTSTNIGTDDTEIEFNFTFDKADTETVVLQINFGMIENFESTSVAATVTLEEVEFVDLSVKDGSIDVKKAYNYTSGRVNTQNKHDFLYGYFEANVRVPKGTGYLPAFWLMATSEDDYGQWPKCGEIDIMEVMGQDTETSHHTIHYGYTADSSKQNQGKYEAEEGHDFYDEYHVFGLDWEPGQITWYVDGVKVYETDDWFTGTDENSNLAYPAPFDHEFYVILNLAVGGSWVGYPDQEVVDDMENQSYDIDYVRVYQKSPEVYAKQEAECIAPVHESNFREADGNGNYVVNGTFTEELKEMDSLEDNWELHRERENLDSTYSRSGDTISISQVVEGTVAHSCQLKQIGIPMYRGWEYELTYDAWAEEPRTMKVDIEGPDNGWTRYFNDTEVALGTKRQTFTHTFTMEKNTDSNGSLEFNLGQQGSTATVHIANVQLKYKSGEEIIEEFQKDVASDGNYVLNGTFDQGEGRLSYWEVDDEDLDKVSVTNDFVESERRRELQVKVEVPEGVSEADPVVITQSELAPVAEGAYDFSFDAYTSDGTSAGVVAMFAGETFIPALTDEKQTFNFSMTFDEVVKRENSYVQFIFTEPGTYYLDNVAAREKAMIKNGSFDAGFAGYEMGVYNGGEATFGVDSQKAGNKTAFDADIKDTGAADYSVQLKQQGVKLKKNSYYKLTFRAKSTVDRTISVVMQGDESKDWNVYSGDNDIDLVSGWTDFDLKFRMTADTDENALLSISMGTIGDRITDVHHVYLDDFVLVETDSNYEPIAVEDDSVLANCWVLVEEVSKWILFDKDGELVKDCWYQLGRERYLFDADGYLVELIGWVENGDDVYYFDENGNQVFGWMYIDDDTCYLHPETGALVYGLQEIDEKTYFFDSDGIMQTESWIELEDGKRFFDEDGEMVTGYVLIGTKWYFLDPETGVAIIGWMEDDGVWHYFSAGGVMATGWKQVGKKWYYFDADGVMQTGWLEQGTKWFYLEGSGAMATGWKKVGKKWYYFNAKGEMLTGWLTLSGKTYYLEASGAMATGWKKINSKDYYFWSSGEMASNEYVNGYWLNKDGTWTYKLRSSWHKSGTRYWYGDGKWYACNATYTIDGKKCAFDNKGYWIEDK